jgi:hypothetical protein
MERICPHCKNPIYDDDALLCLYCGGSLTRGKHFPGGRFIFIAILLAVLISFLFTFLR